MAEEGEALGAAMVVAAAISVAAILVAAILVAAILPVAAVISVMVAISAVAVSAGLVGVLLVAIALRNTEEGISSTGIASSAEIIFGMEIVSGTIAISFLEVPFCMITPTTGMTIRTTGIIIRTGTTDIRTTDMRTAAFADSWFQSCRRAPPSLARSTIRH
jgi:hypothetical protein